MPARKRPQLRWLTLAELVGILALVVAALGWWDNHRERLQQDHDRAAARSEEQASARAAQRRDAFLLTAASVDSDRIRLAPARADQVIQTQTVVFPSAVRKDPVETTGNPRLERRWFEDGLKNSGRLPKDEQEGRLPVGIVTTYVEAGETRTDRSIYQVGYTLKHRLLRGARVQMDGLSLARRGVGGDLQAAVDGAWGPAPQ